MKRIFDFLLSSLGLLALSPLFLVVALLIKFDSKGPVFFRQQRVGRHGRVFGIHKFRTMITNSEKFGSKITVDGDSRITRVGLFLRRYKIDELPQLIDVMRGQMSLVGPRPEVPIYVNAYPPGIRELVLSVRPGITDNASILYRRENSILAESENPDRTYVEQILPEKIELYVDYVRTRSFFGDVKIIIITLFMIFRK